jgi:hypothetical protein
MDERNRRSYIGKSGQMVVMAELLARGCNVAIPEIDVGEDLFTFKDGQHLIDRIQVKTANARRLRISDGYVARISLPLAQLRAKDDPELHYVFPIRLDEKWTDFVVISRKNLRLLQVLEAIGSENTKSGELQLRLIFDPKSLTCKGHDLSRFRDAWNLLPILKP